METNLFTRRAFISRGLETTNLLIAGSLVCSPGRLKAQQARPGNPLRIPPVWDGSTLTAAPASMEVWRGFPTTLLAINGSVPSPTIRVRKGQQFAARIENHLMDSLVIHWHGIIAPPNMDGHPKDAMLPGKTYNVDFPIIQRAGTYFYHPHTEPLTGKLVYSGLAGAFIVEDSAEETLGLPIGEYDVPLLIQDKRVTANRQVVYNPSMMDTMTGFLGDTVLVNATPEAYLSVDKSLYRFRLVNGSNARVYNLGLSDSRPFHLIAADGGLLSAPVQVTSAFLAPGQRLEILVDFSGYRVGDSVVLRSLKFTPNTMGAMGSMGGTDGGMSSGTAQMGGMVGTENTGGMGMGMDMGMGTQGAEMDILRFYVDRETKGPGSKPNVLSPIAPFDRTQARRTRTFTLDMVGMMSHGINGALFSLNRVDFSVPFGEFEIWEFRNTTDEIHPMHPHGALFQVLDRNGNTKLPPEDTGWKDTVLVWPNETVRILIHFDAYAGLFVSHCHNLEHEDSGMMQNFAVLPPSPVRLEVVRQGNQVTISYPASASDYTLETADGIAEPARWTSVSQKPMLNGDRLTVTLIETSGSRFYRLRKLSQLAGQLTDSDHSSHHP